MCSKSAEAHFLFSLAVQLLTITSLSGCTVKENRNFCPCLFSLHLESSSDQLGTTAVFFNGTYCRFSDTLVFDRKSDFRWLLPKERICILASSPLTEGIGQDGSLKIREGNECPPVYQGTVELDSEQERVEDTLYLCKNFCNLSIRFSKTLGNPFGYLDMVIRGNVCGYDAAGIPIDGSFAVKLFPDAFGRCQVCLPRQKDASLSLDVGTGGENVKSFAIGEYMEEAGYDWEKEDLSDCSMIVDISLTSFDFTISGWKKSVSMKIVI